MCVSVTKCLPKCNNKPENLHKGNFFGKTSFKIIGVNSYNSQNRAQHLHYDILWHAICHLCNLLYFSLPFFKYIWNANFGKFLASLMNSALDQNLEEKKTCNFNFFICMGTFGIFEIMGLFEITNNWKVRQIRHILETWDIFKTFKCFDCDKRLGISVII